MTDRRVVLAVDQGSGGPKVGLVTTHGEVLWWEHHVVSTDYGPGGAATQDADEWWRLITEATRRGVATTGIRAEDVLAVGVTGQWSSTIPVAADGTPVGDCVMWTDTQGGAYSHALVGGPVQGYRPRALATWLRHTGGVPSPSGADPLGHVLHLERDRPEIARRARWYLEPVDQLSMRFTGVAAASHMSMTAAWLTDNRRLDLMGYDETLVAMAGIDASKLPPLVPPLSLIAPVRPDVAADLGISPAAQVITGMPDLHAGTIGSGFVLEHQTHVSIGTSGWISCPMTRKKTDVLRQNATVPGLDTDSYLLGNNQDSAGRCLQWFRDTMATGLGTPPSYAEIARVAGTAAPGSNGVFFTPWLAGERSPIDDRAARAGFHNLGVETTFADLSRAVFEGVAFNTRWLLEAVDHFTGRRADPLRIIGGGAQSDLWCQIVADVCGRSIERVTDPLLCGLRGIGLAGGLALGEIAMADVHALVPSDRTFHPDPANRAVYERMYAEFPRFHRGQKGIFKRLNGSRSGR